MNSFPELTSLLGLISSLSLTFFVVSRNLRSKINVAFLVWGLAVSLWNLGTFCKYRASNATEAWFWLATLHLGTVFLPVASLHLGMLMAQFWKPRALAVLYTITIGIAASIFTGHYFTGVRLLDYGYFAIAGTGMHAYLALYALVSPTTIGLLFWKQRHVPRLHQMRLRILIAALGILLLTGTNDLLLVKGLKFYPFTPLPVIPLGNLGAVIYVVLTSYSVMQHQLLNIHLTLSRVAANLVRLFFLGTFAAALVFGLNAMAPQMFTLTVSLACLAVALASGLFASLAFPRLFARGDEILERRILGDRFEYHDGIRDFIGTMHRYTEPEPLLAQLDELLTRSIGARNYRVMLLHEAQHRFLVLRASPAAAPDDPELGFDSPIFTYFKRHPGAHLASNLAYIIPGHSAEENDAMEQLRQYNAEFCFPFFAGDDPFGVFMIGEKATGEPYTPHDLFLLADLAKNLAITFNQFRLKNKILLAEEMELMGRMSRGLAHDLNNLVTPVSTYLQLIEEQHGRSDGLDELLPVALRNIHTIRAYIREALFFSNTHALHLARVRVDRPIRTAATLAETKFKAKNIRVTLDLTEDAEADLDEVLIQRVVDNLLSNAADASPPGSTIHVRMRPLSRTESRREWFRIEVIDQGEGISKENLKRIFTPYFTTKDKGDKVRGFGLGLAICRKIVHLHGGNLNVITEERKGTTMQIDLPSLQNVKPVEVQEAVLS